MVRLTTTDLFRPRCCTGQSEIVAHAGVIACGGYKPMDQGKRILYGRTSNDASPDTKLAAFHWVLHNLPEPSDRTAF